MHESYAHTTGHEYTEIDDVQTLPQVNACYEDTY